MKIIGSRLEKELRSELLHISHVQPQDSTLQRLLSSVKQAFPDMWSAIVLHWIPEQGEDIFSVLVNDDKIAVFELDRYSGELSNPYDIKNISNYRKGLRKISALKLTLALDKAGGVVVLSKSTTDKF